MSNQKAISTVYANSWGLRIGQIALWVFISIFLSTEDIAAYGLWLVLVGAVGVIRLEGLSLSVLSNPNIELQNTIYSAVLIHVFLGVILGGTLFYFRNDIHSLFRLESSTVYITLYAFLFPISILAQLGRRILQRESKFIEIFTYNWFGFLAQIIGISLALIFVWPQALIVGFISGDLIKSICFGSVSWKASRGGRWDSSVRNYYRLGFIFALNQVAVFMIARADIWIISGFLSKPTLATYVVFKQFLGMIKSSVIDPAEEFVLPLFAKLVKRKALAKIFVRIRRELNNSGELAYLVFTSCVLLIFTLFGSKYAVDYRLLLTMAGLSIAMMHSFALGNLSLTRGTGEELLMYKLAVAGVLLGCLSLSTEYTLTQFLLVATVGVVFLNVVFEWYSKRIYWGIKDVVFTGLLSVTVGILHFFSLTTTMLLIILISILLSFSWYKNGGIDLLMKRIGRANHTGVFKTK